MLHRWNPFPATPKTRLGCFLALLTAALANAGPPAAAVPNQLTPQEVAEGWILLFDGTTLFGWNPSAKADWKVQQGVISASQGEPNALLTTSRFGNYVLKVDFHEETSGWQHLEWTADGGRVRVKLDGKRGALPDEQQPMGPTTLPVVQTPPHPARGHIGLQFSRGKIEFRSIKLKPLGMKQLFNGKDLSGWKVYSESVAKITPEGWIHLTGGKGQLESEEQFADFTFQLEGFVNGRGINSGVFFRSIPGQMWNGYESQIHNGFRDGDRTRPTDCGTGGIFRRQNARKVVPNDLEWFAMTIHADGPHLAVWVNGYQVSDWTDTREPADNPRKGLRLRAGTIILQGHDPTSDFYFRNLRIAELPPAVR